MSTVMEPITTLPPTIAEHPEIAAHSRHQRSLADARSEARERITGFTDRHAALVRQRIDATSVREAKDITEAIDSNAAELARERRRLEDLEAALALARSDGRELVKRIRKELRDAARYAVRETLTDMAAHFADLEVLAKRLENIHALGVVPTPIVPGALLLNLIGRFRVECKSFGIRA